jgi:hypothetical protein
MSATVKVRLAPDGFHEIELDGRVEQRVKFSPNEICEMEIDGERQVMININGLSKMLITGGVDNPKWPRFIDIAEHTAERVNESVTPDDWLRFREAVAIARADWKTRPV